MTSISVYLLPLKARKCGERVHFFLFCYIFCIQYSCLVELAKELQKADEFTRAVAGSKLALIAEEVAIQ
jgi:hypothetical protein